MAPSFDHLCEADLDDDEFNEDEIDISDLREKFEVQLEQGYDTFVVVDGLPQVTEEQKPKLIKFLLRKLNSVGKTREDSIYMPMGNDGKSLQFAFIEYSRPSEAAAAVRQLDMVPLDKKHTMRVNKITDIERYGGEGRINDKFQPPHVDEFTEKEHFRWWLKDPSGRGRDQFVMFRGETVGVYWNNERDQPENVVDRQHWTETFLQWSPLGTYLTSMHQQGVQLWGGQSWSRQARFAHPYVNLVAFSPHEKYIVTWSRREISIPDSGHAALSIEDDGKNYIIWDIATATPLRSFANLDAPKGEEGKPPAKMQWPAFKWSADEKYVARLVQGTSISVYELPRMNLLDKTSIKIDGVMDFDWAPATPQRENIKRYEQLFCFWTPEIGSNPAKVGLMSIPSKQIVRTLNLFSVSDAKLHWQSEAAYLCVKVDRHSKSKKSQATTLEIFRVKEKGVPVEVVDTIKDTVINFAWEPRGDRFAIITTTEPVGATAVPPKTAVSFFCPEKNKGPVPGNFKHLRTLEKKNSNAIYWSPRGRFVVIATIHNQQSSDLDFLDLDFEGEKPESEKDLTANLQLMNTADHYGVTDVEWDPSGRFVATWASLLTKEEQKQVRKNLREYSRVFEQEDADRGASADLAVVEGRRYMLEEWLSWRADVVAEFAEERATFGLPADPHLRLLEKTKAMQGPGAEKEQTIEEIVEDVLEESEEVLA